MQSFLGGTTYILNVFFFLEYKTLVGIATVYRVFICSQTAFFSHMNQKLQLALMAKRMSYTVAFKLSVIEFVEKIGNRQAGREFGVNKKLVRDWRKKKSKLSTLPRATRLQHVGVTLHWPKLKSRLHEWVLDKRVNGIGVSGTIIRLKAKAMAKEMSPEDVEAFTGSPPWLYSFMKRKGLVVRQKTKIAQRLSHEFEEKLISFQKMIIRKRKRNGYKLQQLGNMDETPMNFDMPPSRTVNPIGEKSILIKTTGNEKNHFTVVLACLVDCTKLKPMIIFKRKTMPKEAIPPGVIVHVQSKGGIDEVGMKLWIEKVWECHLGGCLKKKA